MSFDLRSSALPLVLSLLVAGCSSLYSRAIDRGDKLASMGRWDEAAAQYDKAVHLEPDEDEARTKLADARRHQAKDRVALGRSLLAEGRPREALKPLAEAVRLDTLSQEARAAFASAHAAAIAEAKKELDAGNTRQALKEAREILAILPADTEALELEGVARTRIADEATAKGRAFEAEGKLAAALVEYGEALVQRPDHAVAGARFSEVRATMRAQVTYHVVLGTFDGDPKADDLGGNVGAADLARGIDAKYLIRVGSTPPAAEGFTLSGMRLGGAFHDYAFTKQRSQTSRTCDYVCGTDLVANPEYAIASADLSARDLDAANAAAAETAAAARVPALDHALGAARRNTAQERREVDAARAALAQCEAASKNPAAECASLRAVRDQAQGEVDRAAADENRAQAELSAAQADEANAESRRFAAASALAAARARFESTPAQISVDRHCDYRYNVDVYTEQSNVDLTLKGEALYEAKPTLNESVTGRFSAVDETFPPEHGRCGILEGGDPLDIPAESVARRKALDSAVSLAEGRIIAAFERFRGDFLSRARTAEADKRADEAIDGYVRYLLTATSASDDATRATASLSGLLSVTPEGVAKATGP